jgi:ribosomal protein S18 acetylase RimI-like enzyme
MARRTTPGEVRVATDKDFASIARIYERSRIVENAIGRLPEWPPDFEWRLRLSAMPEGMTLVATLAEEVVGFVSIDLGDIALLYVAPEHFRRGIGRSLLAAALERAGGRVRVACYERNWPARRLYESAGFLLCETKDGDCRYERS